MAKTFVYIYHFFARNRAWCFAVFISLLIITGFFASRIKPEEDITKILPNDRGSQKLNQLLEDSRFADQLVFMLSLKDSTHPDPDLLSTFADSLTNALQHGYPSLIHSIRNQVSDSLFPSMLSVVMDHLPVFLEPGDYPAADSLTDSTRLEVMLRRNIQTLSSPAGFALKSFLAKDPTGIASPALKKLQQLQYDDNFELYNGHVLSRNHQYMMLFLSPAYPAGNTGKNGELLKAIDQCIAGLQGHFPTVDADYFGGLAVAAGNAEQLRKDSLLTVSLAGVFIFLFLAWYFKRKRAPLIIFLPVLFGALFSLTLIYFIKGSISVIALAAGSVVLGIAINYSLHVYNHFRHRQDMVQVLDDLAFPLTIGGLTTIGGFLCLQFVRSEILKDLGLFAAFSLVGASLASLIFLPHLISSENKTHKKNERDSWILRMANHHPEKNKVLVALIFGATIVFGFFMNRVNFDQDMMHMNYQSPKLKKAEATLNKINDYSLRSVYLITDGKNLTEALNTQQGVNQKLQALQQKQIIKKSSGVFQILISDSAQQQRIRFWNQYWNKQHQDDLVQQLILSGTALGFRVNAFDSARLFLGKNYEPLKRAETEFLKKEFAEDYIMSKNGQTSLITLLKVDPVDKKLIYQTFSRDPNITVVDKQYVTSKLVGVVTADFSQIGWMTSLLVFGVLLLTYGRIELALVSFIPMVIAFVWILGIMGLFGLEFNIVNIILSALIFGLGDDYSLFIMDGLLQEYKTGTRNLSSYKSSIVLSAVTTLAGLGVLIFAKHPAMRSIAGISIIGILSVVLVAQVLIPFFFNLLIRDRVRKNLFPWTATGLLKSIFSLSYFALGSWVLTIVGYILVKWNPFFKSRMRVLFHRLLSSYTWSVLYIMQNVRKTILNTHQEDFSKPCVMIANHQSFLDILVMTMLHPKVVLLTNDWVWSSPVFGKLVRIAGYYPVAGGIENSLEYLESQVNQGYSIAVFPEGTRAPDEQIKRFHKGAFFIAEKLGLDILPILIHGTGYTMSKSDFLLKDGHITIKYLPRIEPGNLYFGVDYTERAKYLGRYFRQQYQLLKKTAEQPRFFRETLLYNYLYKGPVLEWYLRVKIRLEKDYQLFHDLLPKEGRLLDIGCGYGFMSYMLQFASPARDIIGYDYDGEKIAVANHCFSRNNSIHFVEADITKMNPAPADAIILSDVLHYLTPRQQETLLMKCMKALRPDGVLVIRDGDRDLKERHQGTRLTEFFSTKFFAFNKTKNPLHFLSGNSIRELAFHNNMICEQLDNTTYTSNLIFLITHSEIAYEKV